MSATLARSSPEPRPRRRLAGTRAILAVAALGLAGTIGIASAQSLRDFTQDDVGQIVEALGRANPDIYLIRVPVLRSGVIVGSELRGNLPMREVERLAEALRVPLDPDANIIAVFDPGEGGCSGGGGGPGSHINTQSAAWDLASRLDVLLTDIETSRYQFLR